MVGMADGNGLVFKVQTDMSSKKRKKKKGLKKKKKKSKVTWNRGCSSIGLDTHTKNINQTG